MSSETMQLPCRLARYLYAPQLNRDFDIRPKVLP